MSQLVESICYGVASLLLGHALWMHVRDRRRGREASGNPNPAPPGPPPVSQVKPPPPPAPPPPRPALMAPGKVAFDVPTELPARMPRRCAVCGARATHLMGLELAGVDDPGKNRMTIARPLCPAHAAELPGRHVLDLLAPRSWIEIEGVYIARGWGAPHAGRSRFYGVPIDESEFASRFEPAPARGGR